MLLPWVSWCLQCWESAGGPSEHGPLLPLGQKPSCCYHTGCRTAYFLLLSLWPVPSGCVEAFCAAVLSQVDVHPTPPLTTSGKDTACLVTLLVGSAWEKDGGCAALKDVAHPPFARPKGRIHPCFWNDVTSCLSWNSMQLWLRGHKRFQWWRSLLLSTPLIKTYLEDCLRDSQMQVLTFSKAAEISIYSYNSVKWPKSSGSPWDSAQPHGLLPVPGHLLGALASLMSKARHLQEWGLS